MFAVLLLALSLAQLPVTAADQKCTIQGSAVSVATGAPLGKTTLTLKSENHRSTAVGDAQGKFLFEGVEPGEYILSADRYGYLQQGTPVTLDAGQHLKDVVLKLTLQGVISGRVTDEDGDPLPSAEVIWMRSSRIGERMRTLDWNGAQLDAEGGFVIPQLKPGRYYLKAFQENQPRVRESYVATYYPSSINPGGAVAIDIAPGREIRGLEIRLRKAQVFRVRGKAVNLTTALLDQTSLLLMPAEKSELSPENGDRSAQVRDGVFEFVNVLPGAYVIRTSPGSRLDSRTTPAFCSYPITVRNQDVDGVVVSLSGGLELTGNIKMEGRDVRDSTPVKWPSVTLDPIAYYSRVAPHADTQSDGAFHVAGLPPDRYQLRLAGLPSGTYVKRVRYGGQEIVNGQFDLTSGVGGTLDILLAPNAAEVFGNTTAGVQVALWRKDNEPSKFTGSAKDGTFKFANLAPGEYRILAWQDADPELIAIPEFRNRFAKQATRLTLQEGSREDVGVTLIANGVVDVEAAK